MQNWFIAFMATMARGMLALAPPAYQVSLSSVDSTTFKGRPFMVLLNPVGELNMRRRQRRTSQQLSLSSQDADLTSFHYHFLEEDGRFRLARSWVTMLVQSFKKVFTQTVVRFGFGIAPSLRASGFLM